MAIPNNDRIAGKELKNNIKYWATEIQRLLKVGFFL